MRFLKQYWQTLWPFFLLAVVLAYTGIFYPAVMALLVSFIIRAAPMAVLLALIMTVVYIIADWLSYRQRK